MEPYVFQLIKEPSRQINYSPYQPKMRFTINFCEENIDIVEEHNEFGYGFTIANHYTLPTSIAIAVFAMAAKPMSYEESTKDNTADMLEGILCINALSHPIRKLLFSMEVSRIPCYENQEGYHRDLEALELKWGIQHGVADTAETLLKERKRPRGDGNDDDGNDKEVTLSTPKKWSAI